MNSYVFFLIIKFSAYKKVLKVCVSMQLFIILKPNVCTNRKITNEKKKISKKTSFFILFIVVWPLNCCNFLSIESSTWIFLCVVFFIYILGTFFLILYFYFEIMTSTFFFFWCCLIYIFVGELRTFIAIWAGE